MSKKIHEILRDRRIELGISQWALAKMIDKSQSGVWQWEAGKVDPRAYSLELWAGALGVKIKTEVDPNWTLPEVEPEYDTGA